MISDKHLNDEIDVKPNKQIDIGFHFDSPKAYRWADVEILAPIRINLK